MNEKVIQALPKVELHCHLDGSVPFKTLKELAKKQGIAETELAKVFAPRKTANLKQYLESFDVALKLLQTQENLTIATEALIKAVNLENVRYIEIRFAPLLHQAEGLTIPQVIEAVALGVRMAQKKCQVSVNLLLCAMRHHTQTDNLKLLSEIKTINCPLITGFDFAGDEAEVNNQVIASVITQAIKNQLQLTLHSGECGCAQNVVEAIKLGAKRIGHGVAIKDNPNALALCVDSQTLLELCPTSNIQTNAIKDWAEYPLRKFLAAGVKCSINTDNRTVSNTNLTQEYLALFAHCQLTLKEMADLNINAINAAFTTSTVKAKLLEEIRQAYQVS
ncbi:MAG: adenosine deaminase [Streptococcaceae bacterium]|jgi:adenosine deaminase|nr:adenosine deaminase [Streptococcaceae bacterium]